MYAHLSPHAGGPAFNPYAPNPHPLWWVGGAVLAAGGIVGVVYAVRKSREDAVGEPIVEPDGFEGEGFEPPFEDDAVIEGGVGAVGWTAQLIPQPMPGGAVLHLAQVFAPDGTMKVIGPFGHPGTAWTAAQAYASSQGGGTLTKHGAPQVRTGPATSAPSYYPKQGPSASKMQPPPAFYPAQMQYVAPSADQTPPGLPGVGSTGKAATWTPGGTDPSTGKKNVRLSLPAPLTNGGWYPGLSLGPVGEQAYTIYLEHGIKGYRWAIVGAGVAAGRPGAKWWHATANGAIKKALENIRLWTGWTWKETNVFGNGKPLKGFVGVPMKTGKDPVVACNAQGDCELMHWGWS